MTTAKSIIATLALLPAISGSLFANDDSDLSPVTAQLALAPTGGEDLDCEALGRAHAAFLDGCFTAHRQFEATINQKLAMRELARLDYAAGELAIEVIEKAHPNKGIQIGGEGDMTIDSTFSCDRMVRDEAGRYELQSDEDPERIFFDYDADNGVLLPQRWEFEQKARFLFKKFHIQAHADYSNVVFNECSATLDTAREN